jgi:hypothetical protein
MALDKDGTQLYSISGANLVTQMTGADITTINNEAEDGLPAPNGIYRFLLFFPETRDLSAVFIAITTQTPGGTDLTVESSVDTTNGIDGIWAVQVAPIQVMNQTPNIWGREITPGYRDGIRTVAALGIHALRITLTSTYIQPTLRAVHLYGSISAGQNPNRLTLWHPTEDHRVGEAWFDWGNTPRASSADRSFRVKNLSATLTANNVLTSLDILTDTTPSVSSQHTLSSDGASFAATAAAGTLAPGGLSGVMTLRRITPSNATLSLWCLRVAAKAETWS